MGEETSETKVLLITPPFTQLNTPYPATAYLKGYLKTLGVSAHQRDFSLETVLKLFSKKWLGLAFDQAQEANHDSGDENFQWYINNRNRYLSCAVPVIQFLQGKNDSLAYRINSRNFLPEGHRFSRIDDMEWAFGELGLLDKAKYLATLFLEDLGDFITQFVDRDFGFSRYAERLARTATNFDDLHDQLLHKKSIICDIMTELVHDCLDSEKPVMVCITAPFPGNVYGAFFVAKTIKEIDKNIICLLGGGYANTELRSLYDARVFDYFDYITLDDGELPLRQLVAKHIWKEDNILLKRTYFRSDDTVTFTNACRDFDIPQREVGTPDYTDIKWDQYISVLEVLNPMHKMWTDGKWNKLTLAHGCYWGKCTFCDVSLDYIGRYEPVQAELLCDRIEEIMTQSGIRGFHFVDEAAPPALLKDLAIELIKRGIMINWWTNIRFEKAFSFDVCKLLADSGCIAVTGGLEVASDRLLSFMKKGVTIEQVTNVTNHFTKNGILVHAYLMYGFPTETEQETIDSLEVVKQLMEIGLIQSGFWHQFAMTAHSPVGLNPEAFGVIRTGPSFEGFAENDLYHEDPDGAEHEKFSEGLHHAMLNFMHGAGFDLPCNQWFDFSTPKTKIPRGYIKSLINTMLEPVKSHQQVIWLGGEVRLVDNENNSDTDALYFYYNNEDVSIVGPKDLIGFLGKLLSRIHIHHQDFEDMMVEDCMRQFEANVTSMSWSDFLQSYFFYQLREKSLVIV